jgi:hypothetical protein
MKTNDNFEYQAIELHGQWRVSLFVKVGIVWHFGKGVAINVEDNYQCAFP